MGLYEKIDFAIKELWLEDIKKDYNDDFMFKEDTLKNAFYYHLRNRLGDGFLKRNLIRIYTEYLLEDGERADIAIVRLKPKKEVANTEYHLKERVCELMAVVELKYKNGDCNCDPFFSDVSKVKRYIKLKKYESCLFYLGFIHESDYAKDETSWLTPRQQSGWAQGRLVELVAHYQSENDGEFTSMIMSYNNLNEQSFEEV